MPTSLIQWRDEDGRRGVAFQSGNGPARRIRDTASVYALAQAALWERTPLAGVIARRGLAEEIDIRTAEAEGRLLPPVDHPDPAHLYLSGTGLTHLGSAESRDKMHRAAAGGGQSTDSARMFEMGVEGGKPPAGAAGVQPEWFYKGNGTSLVGSGACLVSPPFALDAGEEPEIAGVYLIAPDGTPRRLGFCLANEFSDHVTERTNYLWLAHSKLRPAAIGPELLLGDLPPSIEGTSRILRNGKPLWEREFLTGEANMSHSLANLEHHHFKYGLFRNPGDVHIHFFGTATLSFTDGVRIQDGDVFEISATPFRHRLRNRLVSEGNFPVAVHPL